jgi:hypothetical protein
MDKNTSKSITHSHKLLIAMKASTSQLLCTAAFAGAASLYYNRKVKEQQHAVSSEGAAISSLEWPASSIVMKNSYLVQSILDFVGPGQQLYISTVSKLVQQCYSKVEAVEFAGFDKQTRAKSSLVNAQMTRISEIFGSITRLRLALTSGVDLVLHRPMLKHPAYRQMLNVSRTASPHKAGVARSITLDLMHSRNQMCVGMRGDQEMLTFMHEQLGMPWTEHVADGAIVAGNITLLQWLYAVINCPPSVVSSWLAARHRHCHVLRWLHHNELKFDRATFFVAASHSYIDIMQCLLELGYKISKQTVGKALCGDAVDALQWVHEILHDNIWGIVELTELTEAAACCGSVKITNWLIQQHGAVLNADVMDCAAGSGQLAMCQHLCSIGCTWDDSACSQAAL